MYRFATYVWRDTIRWKRAPLNVLSTLIMPATWLIFMGLVMPVKYDNYLDFVTPGILVLTMLTSSLGAGSSIMFDKTLGYLNKFLALPSPRESILIGKIVFITLRGLLQSTVILLISILIGATIYPISTYIGMYMLLTLFGISISALGTTVALYLDNHDSYAAFQAFVSMPLYFASTALIPMDEMPDALRYIAEFNPLTYAIDGIRDIAKGIIPAFSICFLIILAILIMVICSWKFRSITIG